MTRKTYSLKIHGMHCAACSTRIEKVVGNLKGVSGCSVNLATGNARIVAEKESVSLATLCETIEGLGFRAERLDGSQRVQPQNGAEVIRLRKMKRELLPSFILALSIMWLSMGHMVGIPVPRFLDPLKAPVIHTLVQFILLLPVLYFGRNFYVNGFPALLRGVPNMDSLIAIGTGAACVYSIWNFVEICLGIDPAGRVQDLYFESAAMLLALVSLGKYLEARSKARTGDAIRRLLQLTPDQATLLDGNVQRQIPVEEISVADLLLIRPGERIAVDGQVVQGESAVDESMLTGESMPVHKQAGDSLYGGTLNKNGSLTMVAGKVGKDTMLARIVHLVQEAQGGKAPIASLADRISLYFVPVVMLIAACSGIAWFFFGDADFSFSLRIFIAVLVIACPCAMGLATPTSIMVGTGRGAELGVLVKTADVLELAEKVNCVVFDKTGTLTMGRPELNEIVVTGGHGEDLLLSLAAAAQKRSEHPLADAIVRAAEEKGCAEAEADSFLAVPGRGVEAVVSGEGRKFTVLFGNRQFLEERQIAGLTTDIDSAADQHSLQGKTVLYFAVDGTLAALMCVADPLKPDAADTVRRLMSMGIEVVMLTGDNQKTAQAVAEQAGIGKVVAGVLPDRKEQEIVRLQKDGKIVAMVGDGINDAPALARADVGIAMGTGIDVAVESADIVLMSGRLSGVCRAIGLSRATLGNIRQNLFWAFAYNIVGIPVAAGALAIFGGPTLNPMLGGAAMALSSVSVVSNALRLRWYQPEV